MSLGSEDDDRREPFGTLDNLANTDPVYLVNRKELVCIRKKRDRTPDLNRCFLQKNCVRSRISCRWMESSYFDLARDLAAALPPFRAISLRLSFDMAAKPTFALDRLLLPGKLISSFRLRGSVVISFPLA